MTGTSREITQKSKSNLAAAFITVPKERRLDMVSYYAFCRVVDDIVDEPGPSARERREKLDRWRAVIDGREPPEDSLEAEVCALQGKYALPAEYLLLLIEGMEMDLANTRYATFEDLLMYCYRVASAVGLVTVRILGCEDEERRDAYATLLGYSLQLTNILRDIGEDWRRFGRIYLPGDELRAFGLDEGFIGKGSSRDPAFKRLMRFQYERVMDYYAQTETTIPRRDRKALVPCEAMRKIYLAILERIRRDEFQVLEKQYKLGRLSKVAILTRLYLSSLVLRR